jgi:hypothetical protein
VAGTETLGFRPILAPPTISFSNRYLKGNVGSKQKLNLETWVKSESQHPAEMGCLWIISMPTNSISKSEHSERASDASGSSFESPGIVIEVHPEVPEQRRQGPLRICLWQGTGKPIGRTSVSKTKMDVCLGHDADGKTPSRPKNYFG